MRNFTMEYYRYFRMQYTTTWHWLEVGIPMGCAMSPILFVLAMEIVIKAADEAGRCRINGR
jgi:hypothetical protein